MWGWYNPLMSVIFTVKSFQSADGQELRYAHMYAEGHADAGRPLVFVPGLGGSVKYAISLLEKLIPHHGPVYSLDGRGFGLNEALNPQPHPGHYLKDFVPFIRHLQAQGPLRPEREPILIGLSLGGVYVTHYVTRHAHPFKAMVLLAPAFHPHPSLFSLKFRLKNYGQVLFKGLKATTTLPYGVRDLTRNPERYEDPHFMEPMTLPSLYLFLADRLCQKAFARTRLIEVPTALVIPGKDVVCDPQAMAEAFRRIPSPQKAIFSYPELFHDVGQEPHDDQDQICSDLTRWIASLGKTPVSHADASNVTHIRPVTRHSL